MTRQSAGENRVLWGASTIRTLRAIWAAEEVGIDYQHRKIGPRTGETQTPEYRQLNPKRKIPLLVEGDFRLSESVAICNYLFEKYGNKETFLLPRTARERAWHDQWCSFILGELDETSLYVIRRHDSLAYIYGESSIAVESAKQYFAKQLDAACELLSGAYVMGARFSVPDILLTSCLQWARLYGMPIPPRLEGYRQRIVTRQSYVRAKRINQVDKR